MNTFSRIIKVTRTLALSSAIVLTSGAGLVMAGFDSTSTAGGSTSNMGTDITGKNQLTGPQSLNKNYWKIKEDTDIKIKNINEEKNYVDYWLNTGKNDTFKNTTVEDVSTGNINARVALTNRSNVGGTSSAATSPKSGSVSSNNAADPSFSNSVTGPESLNVNKAKIYIDKDLEIKNIAKIKNDVDVNANTGKNDVIKNTVVGDVSTGDINVTGNINNVANSDQCLTCPDLLDLFKGKDSAANLSSDFSNNTTGPDSVNVNKLKLHEDTDVKVLNVAKIKNDVDVNANTGYNDVVKNTVVGDVSTGDITVDFTVANQAN